jgi:UDP-N-acetylglucosamine 2-epimerase (non-hydrolysing)
LPIVVSTHPRTKQRVCGLGENLSPLVRFLPPFGFTDYVRLQTCAYCVLSDSGTISEEASLLDIPAITMREAHERPEGMDAGTLIMSGIDSRELLQAIRIVRNGYVGRRFAGSVPDYEGGEVASKVVRIVMSYIEFVNRVVWAKPAPSHVPLGS